MVRVKKMRSSKDLEQFRQRRPGQARALLDPAASNEGRAAGMCERDYFRMLVASVYSSVRGVTLKPLRAAQVLSW